MFCVYKHTAPNGKVYIGITGRNPLVRWKNGHGYKNNKHFYGAIVNYGWENIRHEILFDGLTKSEAEQKEIELIAQYGSDDREKGYNNCSGGATCIGYKHSVEAKKRIAEYQKSKHVSQDTRKKLSESRKGKKLTKKHRENLSLSRSGEKNWNYGKHFSAEHRRKLGEAHCRVVICIETGEEFFSQEEAAKAKNIKSASGISMACSGRYKKSGGYHWKFKEV